jgi:hypothetical protein
MICDHLQLNIAFRSQINELLYNNLNFDRETISPNFNSLRGRQLAPHNEHEITYEQLDDRM